MKQTDKKILVVDDYSEVRNIIRDYLIKGGYLDISTACNGKDALQKCQKETFDLVITDWNMPELNGLGLLKNLRSNDTLKNIPVIMISNETNKERITDAINKGVNEFLIKPFTISGLMRKVDGVLSNKQINFKKSSRNKNIEEINLSATSKAVNTKKAEVLVVDDLPSNIDVIVGILQDTYDLRVATNGKNALKSALKQPVPDLILLDIMMPEMDGLEVCKQLKKNPITEDIPVIFLTASTNIDTAIKGFNLGAVDYVNKPVNPEILRLRIHNHIELKKSRDALKNQVDTLLENSRLRDDIERITHHDLRSPISSIVGQSDILIDNPMIGGQYRDTIRAIQTSAITAINILNISHDLYKMEMGKYTLKPKPVRLHKIIFKARSELVDLTQSTGVKITYQQEDDKEIYILGEEHLSYSLFFNLIKNAVEASNEGDNVIIDASENIDNQCVEVNIHNQTLIPKHIMNCFFDKYVTFGKKDGVGLGTYSAKYFAKIQHGDISFVSSEGSGTTLKVVLPFYRY